MPGDDFAQMVDPEYSQCISNGWWYGVHVHESHYPATATFFLSDTSSTCSQDPSCVAYPCSATLHDDGDFCSGYDPRDWYNNWVRGFCSGDPDCDFFKDAKEQYIGTDPQDNCPDNSSDAAWPPDMNNNRTVTGIGCMVGQPCYNRRYDLDANGIAQGLDTMFIKPFIGTQCS